MPVATYGITLQIGGISIQKTIGRQASGDATAEVDLLPGAAGELTTRTDDDTGTVTMDAAEHGIETGDVVDVYWSGGRRFGVTVGTVAGTAVPIDAGAGDNLPITTTEIVVVKQQQVNITIDGDNSSIVALSLEPVDPNSTLPGHVDLQDATSASIETINITANAPLVYDVAALSSNPFTGNVITKALATIGSATEGAKLKIAVLQNASPTP
jgi:hypothetical protein